MGLDASFVKGFGPGTHGLVGVFTEQEVDLFKATAVGLYTGKTAHLHNGWSHFNQLIHARHVLTGTLPHVAEDQAEFDFSFHTGIFV